MLDQDLLIHKTASIKDALKGLNKSAKKVLLVVNDTNRLLGTITDGDIRRYILSGRSLEKNIEEVYNKKPVYITKEKLSIKLVKDIFIKNKIELLPILDAENKLIDFTTWDRVFSEDKIKEFNSAKIDIPVVIMAGGTGARLEPFTRILPKPLIPLGDKPIIEIIMDEFNKQGVHAFTIILNHRSEMIKSYFSNTKKDYRINYIKENNFLGSVGGLRLLGKKINDTFIVSNCDVIVKANFREVLNFHKKQKVLLTVISSIQNYKIPYGVIEFKERGDIINIVEKPEYLFTINTGVYIIDRKCLQFIPKNLSFNMTDMIKILIKNKKKVIMYPVSERDYIDIGEWEEYRKAVNKLPLLKI